MALGRQPSGDPGAGGPGRHPVRALPGARIPCFPVCCPGFAPCGKMETEVHPGTDEWPEGLGRVASVSCSIPDMVSTPWSSALSFSLSSCGFFKNL